MFLHILHRMNVTSHLHPYTGDAFGINLRQNLRTLKTNNFYVLDINLIFVTQKQDQAIAHECKRNHQYTRSA